MKYDLRVTQLTETIIKAVYTVKTILLALHHYHKVTIPIEKEEKELCILANGPSINEWLKNSESFSDKEKMCLNDFYRSSVFERVKPKYYSMLDDVYWKDTERFSELAQKVKWKMFLFIPNLAMKNKEYVEVVCSNKYINVVFFNPIVYEGLNRIRNFFWDKQWCVPDLSNSVELCIYFGILMRFSKIYLFGVEHTFFDDLIVDDNNNLCKKDWKHFYEKDADDQKLEKMPWDMSQHLFYAHNMWKTYKMLDAYARKKQIKIYNATENSLIDCFERICMKL